MAEWRLPADWHPVLESETEQPYFSTLREFLKQERAAHTVYPPSKDVFNALAFTPYAEVKVVILGQDPYHEPNQAQGLAFSVREGVMTPPSLRNIFNELQSDVGVPAPKQGSLIAWARQGVLLLNTVLTVRAHQANSHKGKGWENFTDAVIRAVAQKETAVVFILWGSQAIQKTALIDTGRNFIIQSPHPSPLSASRGFFGSKPFSRANAALQTFGLAPIDWRIP